MICPTCWAGETDAVQVLSFGYGHPGPVPEADIVLDLRRGFRNPHSDPAMRELTGFDAPVAPHVDATPGIGALVRHTMAAVVDLVAEVTSRSAGSGCGSMPLSGSSVVTATE